MIERLLPDAVIAVEAFHDVPGEKVFPGEEDLIASAVEVRRREFVTARRCAREALVRLGHPPVAIRPGPKREPLWPAGVVGSLTHCQGYRAAVVARSSEVVSAGVDAEPHGPLPDGVEESIALPEERAMLARLAAAHPGTHWDRLLFSAKESVYKAWYPMAKCWLGFEDARLDVSPDGTFTAHILISGGPSTFAGRHLVDRNLVVTAVTVLP
ncbi:4'-phosphopantetheinyl transferase family protein [Actinoplanes couchii]|uniref:4'-phosphopantetheinyl transferase n=1 Tax=Actinoplanes couchii TaxID=403638 RepID=A0ABQ3XEE2_9ACTN|nr:4'-phosphopantetheinyl transferase superfamily protein [Actinoplanes couchii]MDR6319718.1 4'-phosphopantetheinyl transferase EntD [Actinoplanes couchii]GID56852.1 putative 4'-phosphopantetheinyl transferase [Actinoplanes couchii]